MTALAGYLADGNDYEKWCDLEVFWRFCMIDKCQFLFMLEEVIGDQGNM